MVEIEKKVRLDLPMQLVGVVSGITIWKVEYNHNHKLYVAIDNWQERKKGQQIDILCCTSSLNKMYDYINWVMR